MTELTVVQGDLLELAEQGQFDLVLHGCNCFNTMGGGIARKIADRWPDAYLADQQTVKGDPGKLGTYTWAVHGTLKIVNGYTQYRMARQEGQDVFEYRAFERLLAQVLERWGHLRIGLPMIGMGLAGGDPEQIIPMIEAWSQRVSARGGSVTLVEWVASPKDNEHP